jgi:hypothetical protein
MKSTEMSEPLVDVESGKERRRLFGTRRPAGVREPA